MDKRKTRYGIINPYTRQWFVIESDELDAAKVAAGITPREEDHGKVTRGLAICTNEYGLIEPKHGQTYFALLGSLYAGGAVLYAVDETGATVDFEPDPLLLGTLVFFVDAQEAEAAIQRREVERPRTTVNGVVCWEWRP